MLKPVKYDFIFLGAGCAGLSLLMRMLRSGCFSDKKFLLIDKDSKTKNDRTWCFWESENGFFEDIVYRRWDKISFLSDDYTSSMNIAPYQYKMIRGIDFYQYCFKEIKKHSNIEMVQATVKNWQQEKDELIILTNDLEYRIDTKDTYIFNSIYKEGKQNKNTIRLLQHFRGWVIETPRPCFNMEEASIMDFRVSQEHGTTFAYVLPFSSHSALVEYTLFTRELIQPGEYDAGLRDFISNILKIGEYEVKEEESGVIPMTNEKFSFAGNGWQIGMAGGQTKPSSGFTFQFIQKQSKLIVDCLIAGKSLNSIPLTSGRFRFYDHTLLHILYHNRLPGKKVFTDLFKKNKPRQVLRFLDNESTLKEELKIISSLPTWPFLKAALKQ